MTAFKVKMRINKCIHLNYLNIILFFFSKQFLASEFKIPANYRFNDSLFIGGVKEIKEINHAFKMSKGLKGAMQRV